MRLERILVVDDEAPARRHLVRMLREVAELVEIQEASSVETAAAIITATPAFDCLFLDVQMPIADGFALFERCAITAPVVFVTAYHQHAVRAFEVNALDYLLKPISRDRLVEAMRRLGASRTVATPAFAADDVVWLHERGRQSFVRLAEIVYIAAADDYTELHLADGTSRLCALTMRDWETRAPATFVRIHRSTIVGTTHVVEVRYSSAGASVVVRGVAEPLRIARTHLAALKARLDQ